MPDSRGAERLFAAYPFTAIVGQATMKRALLAAVVSPTLHGVLVRGERGTAKSSAARGLTRLLPEQDVVRGCPYGCDPEDLERACPNCFERVQRGEALERGRRRVPFVSLPVSATEDRVVGSLDLERAVLHGEQRFRPGVLAEAHRGVLYVDEVNLLPDHIMDLLLDAAAMGVNLVEREGVAFSHPSRFILVGTMNPEEGELRPQLTDRFDLSVVVAAERALDERRAVLQRRLDYESDPEAFVAAHADEERALAERLQAARARLAKQEVSDWAARAVCEAAGELQVDGHRGELAAIKVALALAALDGTPLDEAHVAEAIELAFSHRLRRRPFEQERDGEARLGQVVERLRSEGRAPTADRPAPGLPPGKKNG